MKQHAGLIVTCKNEFKEVFELMAYVGKIPLLFKALPQQHKVSLGDAQHMWCANVETGGLEESETIINAMHSTTIGRYIARLSKLYPLDNLEATLSDEYVEILSEFIEESIPIKNPDAEKKISWMLNFFNKVLTPESDAFLVAGKMSWADLYLFSFLDKHKDDLDLTPYDNVKVFNDILVKRLRNKEIEFFTSL